jgi:hypothetical protein
VHYTSLSLIKNQNKKNYFDFINILLVGTFF